MKSGRLKLNLFALQSMTGNVLFLVENTEIFFRKFVYAVHV